MSDIPSSTPTTPFAPRTHMRMIAAIAGIVIAAVIALLIWSSRPDSGPADAPSAPAPSAPSAETPAAALWLALPEDGALTAGREGIVEIRFDTKGQAVNAMHAVVTFDPAAAEVAAIDGDGSSFPMEAVPPKAIQPGRAELVRFIVNETQDPDFRGVSGEGLLARLRVRPLLPGPFTLSLSPADAQYAPKGSVEVYEFTDITDGNFVVQ